MAYGRDPEEARRNVEALALHRAWEGTLAVSFM